MKSYIYMITSSILLLACQQDTKQIKTVYKLPKSLKEVSGITYGSDTRILWMIEDSGNKNKIYGLDSKGKIVKEITISNTKNIDWEDLTKDNSGNLYIGDFGNNDNERKDLCIYKISKDKLAQKSAKPEYAVNFSYPEQKDFPPKKNDLVYDVESFFEHKNNFYLFTKNRSKHFDGTTYLYKVPNKAGTYKAQLLGSFKAGNTFDTAAITSADISPNDSKVALLSHTKIFIFEEFKTDNFLSGKVKSVDLGHNTQKESIIFKDDNTLLIADEKDKNTGGYLYSVDLREAKLEAQP